MHSFLTPFVCWLVDNSADWQRLQGYRWLSGVFLYMGLLRNMRFDQNNPDQLNQNPESNIHDWLHIIIVVVSCRLNAEFLLVSWKWTLNSNSIHRLNTTYLKIHQMLPTTNVRKKEKHSGGQSKNKQQFEAWDAILHN